MSTTVESGWKIAFAIEQEALNRVLGEIYAAAPSLFTAALPLDGGGQATVAFKEAPRLAIGAVTSVNTLKGQGTLSCGHLEIVVTGPGAVHCPATLSCLVRGYRSGTGNRLVAEGIELEIGYDDPFVPPQPLRDTISGKMLGYLTGQLFPALGISVGIADGFPDTVFVAESHGGNRSLLVAYAGPSGLQAPASPLPLLPYEVLVALDGAVVGALLVGALPPLSNSGGIPSPNYSWDWNVSVSARVDLNQPADALRLASQVSGRMNVTFHAEGILPNVSGGSDIRFGMAGPIVFDLRQQFVIGRLDPTALLNCQVTTMSLSQSLEYNFGWSLWPPANRNEFLAEAAPSIMMEIQQRLGRALTNISLLELAPAVIEVPGAPSLELQWDEPRLDTESTSQLLLAGVPSVRRRAAAAGTA